MSKYASKLHWLDTLQSTEGNVHRKNKTYALHPVVGLRKLAAVWLKRAFSCVFINAMVTRENVLGQSLTRRIPCNALIGNGKIMKIIITPARCALPLWISAQANMIANSHALIH